eukprot:TRINITY_DN1488_c0_g5_i1.p1 TRINITY_DN1488_c0_g5~~TRINITY_DN1488_c0_g5_i1.p1  ORF type:complete len:1337 (+),score=510.48 TRINITY_DN1488_c0_g5_i1:201-4211(+)
MAPPKDALCYFRHPDDSWVWGRVTGHNAKAKKVTLKAEDDAGNPRADPGKVPPVMTEGKWAGAWPPPVPAAAAEVPDNDDHVFQVREDIVYSDEYENTHDLLRLTILHDSTLLSCIKKRYFEDIIYTFIGAIVVAVNPFNYKIPWYEDTPANMNKYLEESYPIQKNLPHSWACAHNTYHELIADFKNQTILVSGESGAGKTEASKIVLKYLGVISQRMGGAGAKEEGLDIQGKIMAASPFLEAFGNAKTSRNDNSSRFGKFMTIKFNDDGAVIGANITKYLLEKSRIVTAGPGERCYHSFYLAVRGNGKPLGPTSLKSDKAFESINAGGVVNNNEFDSYEEFQEVSQSMMQVGIADREVAGIWAVLAGILHTLNIEFEKKGEGCGIKSKTKDQIGAAAACLEIDTDYYQKELVRNIITVNKEKSEKQLPPSKALDGRDAFVKRLYDQMFTWLVVKCNETLDVPECRGWIGLLDIFGFEQFEVNSFEQLCINTANEALQGNYNHHVFSRDMDECRAEGVDVTEVEFPDNTDCIKLICANKPMGIFAYLDAASKLSSGDRKEDTDWLDTLVGAFDKKHKYFEKKRLARDSFIVKHFAGDVSYTVKDFVSKNADTLKVDWHHVVASSRKQFMRDINWEVGGKPLTVAGFFKRQLDELMDIINSSNPHWIRCVKPHPAKKMMLFDGNSVCFQLTTSGVLATVAIRKAGYPVRLLFADFVKRYRVMFWDQPGGAPADPKAASAELLKVMGFGKAMAQIGTTRVFLKQSAYVEFEDAKRVASSHVATRCQAFMRTKLTLLNEWRPRLWARSCETIQGEVRCFLEKSRDVRRQRAAWRRRLEEATQEGVVRNGLAEAEARARTELDAELGRYTVWVLKRKEEIRALGRSLEEVEEQARLAEEAGEAAARETIDFKLNFNKTHKHCLECEFEETRARRQMERDIHGLWMQLLAVWTPMQLFELETGRGVSERTGRRRIADEERAMRSTIRMFETEGMAFVSVYVAQDDEEKARNDVVYEQIVAFQNLRRAEIAASKRVLMQSTLSMLKAAGAPAEAHPRRGSPAHSGRSGGPWGATPTRSSHSTPRHGTATSPRRPDPLPHAASCESFGSPLSQAPSHPRTPLGRATPMALPNAQPSFEDAAERMDGATRQGTFPLQHASGVSFETPLYPDAAAAPPPPLPLQMSVESQVLNQSLLSITSLPSNFNASMPGPVVSPTGRHPGFMPIAAAGQRYASAPSVSTYYTSVHAAHPPSNASIASLASVGTAPVGPGASFGYPPLSAGRQSPAQSLQAAAAHGRDPLGLTASAQSSAATSPRSAAGSFAGGGPRSPLRGAAAKAKGWWDE